MVIALVIQGAGLANSTPDYFEKVTVAEAMHKAGENGKLYFVDFYADWCTPCKWMDQTVFSDERIAAALKANYVPIKVNIDDLEGFEMKEKYQIKTLPTMLIFNSKGKMVERIEETLDTKELLEVLDMHNKTQNKVIIKHDINISPSKGHPGFERSELEKTYLRYIESSSKRTRNYRLQMGIYIDYESAFEKVRSLKNTFLEPIIVINDFVDEKVRFKVMMGEFPTMDEAKSFQKILKKEFELDAIID